MKHSTLASTDSLDITVDHGEQGTIVRLHGRLGLDSSPTLRDRLLAILRGQPPKAVTVDLTEVSHIDLSGVATLLEALKVARGRQTGLCLKGLKGRILRLFEVTGLKTLFEAKSCKGPSSQLKGT